MKSFFSLHVFLWGKNFSGKHGLKCNKQRLVYLESNKKRKAKCLKDVNSDFFWFSSSVKYSWDSNRLISKHSKNLEGTAPYMYVEGSPILSFILFFVVKKISRKYIFDSLKSIRFNIHFVLHICRREKNIRKSVKYIYIYIFFYLSFFAWLSNIIYHILLQQ